MCLYRHMYHVQSSIHVQYFSSPPKDPISAISSSPRQMSVGRQELLGKKEGMCWTRIGCPGQERRCETGKICLSAKPGDATLPPQQLMSCFSLQLYCIFSITKYQDHHDHDMSKFDHLHLNLSVYICVGDDDGGRTRFT